MRYPRIEAAMFDRPWALMPSKMEILCEILDRRISGDFAVPEGFIASNGAEPTTTEDGVRIIPVHGVMGKRMNLLDAMSGGVSTEQVGAQIQSAVNDPDVSGIMLDIDSPGGSVDGSFALADLVFESRGSKPIVAFADGMAASAAYLLASAADRIIANQTADVGSIGVIAMHTDTSGQDSQLGIKREYLTAGRYKASGRDGMPLDKEGREEIQGQLDQLYSIFVDKVARNRGVSAQVVLSDMADGRVYIGESAREHNLVDEIGERGVAINAVLSASHSTTNLNMRGTSALSTGPRGKGVETMSTVMDSIRLVLEGRAEEAEEQDRENAEAIVSLCREHFDTEAKAKAETDAKDVADIDATSNESDVSATGVPKTEIVIRQEERERCAAIRKLCESLNLSASYADGLIDKDVSLETASLAATTEAMQRQSALSVSTDEEETPLTTAKTDGRSEKDVAEVVAYQSEHGVDFRTAALAVQGKEN